MVHRNAKRTLNYEEIDNPTTFFQQPTNIVGHMTETNQIGTALRDHQAEAEDFIDSDQTVTEHNSQETNVERKSGF